MVTFIEKNIPEGFNFFVNSNTLENAYLEIDRQQETATFDFNKEIIDKLYRPQKRNTLQKTFLVFKNKMITFSNDKVEIFKCLIITGFSLLFLYSAKVLFLRKFEQGLLYMHYFLIVYLLIDVSVHPFSVYNYVYEKENDIKLLMHTHKISINQYYLGKFLADLLIYSVNFALLTLGFRVIIKDNISERLFLS